MITSASSFTPSLEPRFPVPDELESWIHRAMSADPERRFRRAAEAAWALPRAILADETTVESGADPDDEGAPTATTQREQLAATMTLRGLDETHPAGAASTRGDASTGTAETLAAAEAEAETPPASRGTADSPDAGIGEFGPPVPDDWQHEPTESLPDPLIGAGLGLFGLREPPFVNRREACDRIWGALHDVVETQTTRTVFIGGEAGTGKSRLAEWMATRAHEVGAVEVVRAVHSRGGGPSEGRGIASRARTRSTP